MSKGAAHVEDFWGIRYEAKRGDDLTITASREDFYLYIADGVLNIMSYELCGRTAVFVDDCRYVCDSRDEIVVIIHPGTGSYMKELSRVRKVSKHEHAAHNLGRLW